MLPNLIHPIPVFIRKAEKNLTAIQDANLHEPVGQVRRPQVAERFLAQISWNQDKNISQEEAGIKESSDGYVLFRTIDLRARYFTVEIGDKIIQIGEGAAIQETHLYIVSLKWMGHYQDQRGASLLRAYFADRSPSRN